MKEPWLRIELTDGFALVFAIYVLVAAVTFLIDVVNYLRTHL